jgi:AcrR family transcriptional regulator
VSTAQRDPVRTRRAVLEAAARLVAERGSGVCLDLVAQAAGVSKGGLLHHFRSREALFAGLVEEWLSRFDAAVERHVEPDDQQPGRLTRAYIRANFDIDATDLDEKLWRNPAILSVLMTMPGVLRLADENDRGWRAALADDGLPPDRVVLITSALDGMVYSQLFHGRDDQDGDGLQDVLLALTRSQDPLVPTGAAPR